MKTFVQGTDLTIAVPLQRDGEPFVPDANTVAWALHGQDGSQLATGTLTGVTDTTAFLPVVAVNNAISGGRKFEKRIVVLSGTSGALPFSIRSPYGLIAWSNFTATEDDVRSFIGVGPGELPDADIDMVAAYLDVGSYITQPILDAALVAGDQLEVEANRAIVSRAVLIVLPSLQARISKSESDGTLDVTRQDIDFAELEERASQQLSRSLDTVAPRDVVTPLLVAFTARDDIFLTPCARF